MTHVFAFFHVYIVSYMYIIYIYKFILTPGVHTLPGKHISKCQKKSAEMFGTYISPFYVRPYSFTITNILYTSSKKTNKNVS